MSISKTKRFSEDDAFLEVLFHRLAFQYDGQVWYDVHPLITELPDFMSHQKTARTRKTAKKQ